MGLARHQPATQILIMDSAAAIATKLCGSAQGAPTSVCADGATIGGLGNICQQQCIWDTDARLNRSSDRLLLSPGGTGNCSETFGMSSDSHRMEIPSEAARIASPGPRSPPGRNHLEPIMWITQRTSGGSHPNTIPMIVDTL